MFLFIYAEIENGGERKRMGERGRRWEEMLMEFVEKKKWDRICGEEGRKHLREGENASVREETLVSWREINFTCFGSLP